MLKLKLQSFGHLMQRANSLEKRTLFTWSGTKSQLKRREKLLGVYWYFWRKLPPFLLLLQQKSDLSPDNQPENSPPPRDCSSPRTSACGPGSPLQDVGLLSPARSLTELLSMAFHHTHFCCKLYFHFPAGISFGWGLSPQGRHVTWLWHFLHLPPSFPPSLRSWVSSKRKFPSDSVTWCKRRAVLIRICLLWCLFQLWSKFKGSFLSSLCVSDPPKKQWSRSKWKCLILLRPRNMSIWGKAQERVAFLF